MENVFPFGVDNGGDVYFFDLKNRAGFGENAVFSVYPGNPNWSDSFYCAKSLTELLSNFITGRYFEDGKQLE